MTATQPISNAKAQANAANAQHSTGPRTAEGKARSAQNARRHGLSAVYLVVRDDEREEFDLFEQNLITEVQPCNWLEMETFRRLLHAGWNLRRLERLEAELFDGETDPMADPDHDATLDRYARYHQRHERSYYRALKELKALQTQRGLKQIAAERQELIDDAPMLADNMLLAKRTQPLDVFETLQRMMDGDGGEHVFANLLRMAQARFGKSCQDFAQFNQDVQEGAPKYAR